MYNKDKILLNIEKLDNLLTKMIIRDAISEEIKAYYDLPKQMRFDNTRFAIRVSIVKLRNLYYDLYYPEIKLHDPKHLAWQEIEALAGHVTDF